MMADEGFIQFIWRHQLLGGKSLSTCCGKKLQVVIPGEHNVHGGPDFLNARVRIDHLLWAGNVEIHRCASDWYRHQHHLDPAYNNVILHVVGDFDTDVYNSLGRRIQTLVPELPVNLCRRYEILRRSENWLPCGDYLRDFSFSDLTCWFNELHVERITQKSQLMKRILHESGPDLNHGLYRALGMGFGIPLNTTPFDLLTAKAPLRSLLDHQHRLSDLEAILFGLSGMLAPARAMGPYPAALWCRFQELREYIKARPVPAHLWKFMRLRPASFPTLRISQFASLIHHRSPMAESLLGSASLGDLEQALRVRASEYWTNHYLFGKASSPLPKNTGQQLISTLNINIIIPFLTALQDLKCCGNSLLETNGILQNLQAENNQIIKNWSIFGIRAQNAMESQALLQLYYGYCKNRRCLECKIGTEIVKHVSRQ